MKPALRNLLLTWLALLALLALSAASSLVDMGLANPVSNFGIAGVKAALVLLVFMRIGRSATVVRIAAVAGLLWLSLLVGLGLADFVTRMS